MRGILGKALAIIQEMKEQPLENQDMAQSMDVSMAATMPAAVEDI